MNTGALLLNEKFIDVTQLEAMYRHINSDSWKPTWEDGSYGGDHWRAIKLIVNNEKTNYFEHFPEVQRVIDKFECNIINMMFYSMLPGGKIHPHRDMVGNVGLGGLRFHIPIITNPGVMFIVSRKRVIMKPGELWALDTSYEHSVENNGAEDRVHLVFDVKVNDWMRNTLPPNDYRYRLHQMNLLYLAFAKGIKTVLMNPQKIKGNLSVLKKVIAQLKTKQ